MSKSARSTLNSPGGISIMAIIILFLAHFHKDHIRITLFIWGNERMYFCSLILTKSFKEFFPIGQFSTFSRAFKEYYKKRLFLSRAFPLNSSSYNIVANGDNTKVILMCLHRGLEKVVCWKTHVKFHETAPLR
jgi:hypothetical protein